MLRVADLFLCLRKVHAFLPINALLNFTLIILLALAGAYGASLHA